MPVNIHVASLIPVVVSALSNSWAFSLLWVAYATSVSCICCAHHCASIPPPPLAMVTITFSFSAPGLFCLANVLSLGDSFFCVWLGASPSSWAYLTFSSHWASSCLNSLAMLASSFTSSCSSHRSRPSWQMLLPRGSWPPRTCSSSS